MEGDSCMVFDQESDPRQDYAPTYTYYDSDSNNRNKSCINSNSNNCNFYLVCILLTVPL